MSVRDPSVQFVDIMKKQAHGSWKIIV